ATGSSSFLRELTSLTGGTAYNIDSARDLRATFLRILDEFRHRYLVSYTPHGVGRNGWHRLDVRLKNRRATIKARPGYLAGTCASSRQPHASARPGRAGELDAPERAAVVERSLGFHEGRRRSAENPHVRTGG